MLSGAVQFLIQGYRTHAAKRGTDGTVVTIHVDEIASKIAKVYEQIRNVVDYREEHLLRKNSIFRALQRHLVIRKEKENVADALVREIIRSGHLPNDAIPEEKIADVDRLISNLLFLLERLPHTAPDAGRGLSEWLLRITASAIEENLDPPVKDRLAAETMFTALRDHIVIKGKEMNDTDKAVQLFIGIERALLRVDDDQLAWRLLRFLYPAWENPTPEELAFFSEELLKIKKAIDDHRAHPLGSIFFKFCNRYNTVFLLLNDAIFEEKNFLRGPEELFQDGKNLAMAVNEAYRNRYLRQKRRLRRLAFFTIISLFITKVAVALAVEIPIDVYVTRDYSLANTAFNIAFPPFLMLVILALIRLPSKRNLALVHEETRAVAFEEYRKEYLIVIPEEKSQRVRRLVRAVYVVISLAVLYGVLKLLSFIDFSIASTIVFILFTSIVAATGVRVHNRSKELSLEEDKPSFLSFLGDLLFMPFVTMGQLAIRGLGHFKHLVILVNLIEAPLQVFLTFVENLNIFIRSKKDELH